MLSRTQVRVMLSLSSAIIYFKSPTISSVPHYTLKGIIFLVTYFGSALIDCDPGAKIYVHSFHNTLKNVCSPYKAPTVVSS